MKRIILAVCVLALLPLPVNADSPQRVASDKATFVLENIIEGLGVPWGMAFISANQLLVTEREGNIKLLDTRSKALTTLQGAPDVLAEGQGGMEAHRAGQADGIYRGAAYWRATGGTGGRQNKASGVVERQVSRLAAGIMGWLPPDGYDPYVGIPRYGRSQS